MCSDRVAHRRTPVVGPRRGVTAASWSVALVALATSGRAFAEPDDPDADPASQIAEINDVQELSLADLLDAQVDIASKKPQTARETPGIVTVITRDDIINSGARELLDVLALVPGFVMGADVASTIGLGVRGQYANEGKMLFLIDGQPLNDLLYGSLQLGNRYPLEAIDHIEVIRGPGSAIYGGSAELAVISIVTRDAASLEGVAVASSYGRLGHTTGHASASLAFGTTSTGVNGLSIAGSMTVGHSGGEGTYRDFSGASYAMTGNSGVDPLFVKLAVAFRGLHIDGIFDNYALEARDGFGPIDPVTVHCGFRTYALALRYELGLAEHLTLTPRFDVLRQTPWEVLDASSQVFYAKTISRTTGGLTLSYDPTRGLNLLAGVEAYADQAHIDDPRLIGFQTLFGDQTDVTYATIATYAQLLANHRIANLTLGVRYEHQGSVGGSFVPRIALTKVVGRFHAKLLASQGYRAPSVENINASHGDLQPEKTTVFEAEAGYELGDHMFAAVDAFDVTTRNPIIYEVNTTTLAEVYENSNRTGTRGFELDYRIKYPRGSANLTYSYYTAASKNDAEAYRVPGHDSLLLALPAHKVTMIGNLRLTHRLMFTPSAVIYGERYGYTTGDVDGNPVLGREPPVALVNLYLLYRNALLPGLDLGAGVYNVADQRFDNLEAFTGGHAPMPTPGRELVFRVAYERKL